MIDKVSEQRIMLLHPKVRDSAMKVLNRAAVELSGSAQLRIAQGLRTFKEQEAIYAQGRTAPGKIVSNAKPGYSYHNYGLAFDIVLLINGKDISYDMVKDFDGDGFADWKEIVRICQSEGWQWGDTFKDYPHFQKTFGYKESALLAKYNKKDFIPGTVYVNI